MTDKTIAAGELMEPKPSKGIKIPHVWTILLFCLIAGGIMTYVVPAGQYDRVTVDGRQVIDPATFHYVEQTPVKPFGWFICIVEGLTATMPIMCLVFFPIAATEIYTESGTLRKLISWILKVTRNNDTLVMLALMIFFAIRGAMGAFELHIPFVPLTIGLALACGCDIMVGLALALIPTFVSFAMGPLNVYTVAVAQGIAGLPVYSAMTFRVIVWGVMMIVTFWYILRYANKVKRNPALSVTGFVNPSLAAEEYDLEAMKEETMTGKQKILTFMFLATIVIQMVGPMRFGWGFAEIASCWLISGILAGLIAGFNNEKICHLIGRSCESILVGTSCIGVARSVSIVLTKGNILDTIIYGLSIPLKEIPVMFSAFGMFLMQSIINFFIPSGSGQASVTMPIMAPLADVVGMTRQTAVMAFQLGDGITNLIIPTMGALIVYIGVAKVEFKVYLKWVFPLYLMLVGISFVALTAATLLKIGPF